MNLATVIDPRTGHVDAERVAFLMLREAGCGYSLAELIRLGYAKLRVHVRPGPPGQGRSPGRPLSWT